MTRRLRVFALALGLCAFSGTTASAQFALGLTGGVNSSTLNGSGADSLNVSAKTGGGGGVYGNIYLGSRLSVEGQLLFTAQGFDADTAGVAVSTAQSFIQIPMLLKVYFGKLNIFAGPAVSWQTTCSVDGVTDAGSCNSSSSSLWSAIIGAGVQFGHLGVEGHYQAGLSDLSPDLSASYGVWSLMARLAILGSR